MKWVPGLMQHKFTRWILGGTLATALALAANMATPTAAAADHIRPALPGISPVYVGGRRHQYRHRHYRPPHWGHRDWRYRHHRRYRPYRRSGVYFGYGGNGAAAVIGLATGAILGQALGAPRYIDPPVRRVYRGRHPPWTPGWYSYCARKYRSFNPDTGYFLAYSGRYRFCR
ncbi:BA14K family protein [Stappia sp.]|uniref:BA14K family protein n=1 Tax=Stappia sp. TaxID=1870903 RepID=UPI003A99F3C4